jgi:hypothetical protein
MSTRISPRRVVVTTVLALACAASTASHATAMPIAGGGDPQAVPPILPVPDAAQRRAILAAEAEKSARFAYRLPAGARWSSVEMDFYATQSQR